MADQKISELTDATFVGGANELPIVQGGSTLAATVAMLAGAGHRAITGADTVAQSDRAKVIEITSGTFALAFTAKATLGAGFWCWLYNSGSGVVTLDPNSSETIDGQTTIALNAGVMRFVYLDSTPNIRTLPIGQQVVASNTYSADDTWSRHPWAKLVYVDVVGGGGGGGGGRSGVNSVIRLGGGGGGGGARQRHWFLAIDLGSTEAVTVGIAGTSGGVTTQANGSNGGAGGDSSFGTWLKAYGGGGGSGGGNGGASSARGGGGGGVMSAGVTATAGNSNPSNAGHPALDDWEHNVGYGGGSGGWQTNPGYMAVWGGGGGGANNGNAVTTALAGGVSVYGGGGGGGGGTADASNGEFAGGAGGDATGNSGAIIGGGGTAGAANGGAGGAGSVGAAFGRSGDGGGGGGGQAANSAGGVGGVGGIPGGGGGGGGGAGTTSALGGVGGIGGAGRVYVLQVG